MKRLAPILALVLLLVCLPVAQAEVGPSASQRKQAAEQAKADLRQRIKGVQARLEQKSAQFKRATDALQQSEQAISSSTRRLAQLTQAAGALEQAVLSLADDVKTTQLQLQTDRQALADQLRAQYASDLSAWSALFSGVDPQSLERDLGYLSFVSRARADVIARLNAGMVELSALQTAQTEQQAALEAQQQQVRAEQDQLKQERQSHKKLLAELDGAIAAERAERDKLAQDEAQLTDLIESLGREIAEIKSNASQTQAVLQRKLEGLPESAGLKRGIAPPVAGPVVARFGSSRPDGGDWRGILIDVDAGTPVKTVASGTVVYATWLRGFGNLIIVDHGDEFLTVYAYNQSLLKQVGDTVEARDVIAQAGNSGGQLDSALYFEIRHRGQPLDPQLYIKR